MTAFLLASILFTADAHAYVDPGMGSYLLQILLASMLAVFFSAKLFWRKTKVRLAEFCKGRFGSRKNQKSHEESK